MIGLPLLHNWMQDRDQNYKSVKEHLFIYGFQKKTVKSFIKSRDINRITRPRMLFLKILRYSLQKNWASALFTKVHHSKIDLEGNYLFQCSRKHPFQ
jgi:CMP-2-keto-3-deoxyoctulosonic acid synthetase